jgi:hypothetical protein
MKGLSKVASASALAVLWAFSSSANALVLAIPDSNYLGYVNDGIPSSPTDEANYINSLLDMGAGDSAEVCTFDADEMCDRSASTLDATGLPDALVAGSIKDETTANTNIDVTGWTYLLAKYDGPNHGSEVWYVGNLSGTLDIPSEAGPLKSYGLSHYSLYNLTTECCTQTVPEPTSLTLLGGSLIGFALLRRRRRRLA